jgi:NADH-quinone oxidoreductase subunit E
VLGMFKAMRTTLRHLPMRKITVEYPEQRDRLPERSRGLFRVVVDPASGDPRCRACTLCETNCPVQVIRVNYTSKYQLTAPNVARVATRRLEAQADVDLKKLQPVLDDFYEHGTGLIAVLQNTQEVYGYLPRAALQEISLQSGVSLSQIYGVSSFYNQFRLSPIGKHLIDVCHGTACHVAGAQQITEALEEELGVADGKTTKDRLFTLGSVACMGACSQAPVMRIGEETYGNLTPDSTRKIIRDLMQQVGAEKG